VAEHSRPIQLPHNCFEFSKPFSETCLEKLQSSAANHRRYEQLQGRVFVGANFHRDRKWGFCHERSNWVQRVMLYHRSRRSRRDQGRRTTLDVFAALGVLPNILGEAGQSFGIAISQPQQGQSLTYGFSVTAEKGVMTSSD
jgi:hypothetical protein